MSTITPPRTRDAQWIGGRWVASDATTGIDVINPSDESVIAQVPAGTAADVDRAVTAAVAAFDGWAATPLPERLAFLHRFVGLLEARSEELVDVIVAEVGAPLRVARGAQVGLAIGLAASYLDIAGSFAFERRVGNSVVTRGPAGVVATITPWNVPLLLSLQKIIPAIIGGCTVVHKPSEITPLSGYVLADILAETWLPPGVFNMVVGTGPQAGAALARHPQVDLISLTGSTRAGRQVIRASADTIKRVHLELGGKNASVVLPDADLPLAVRATVDQACFNTGQTCLQWSRLLVPADRADEAADLAGQVASGYQVGDPRDDSTDMGPLVSAAALDRVTGHIQQAIRDGASLVCGGPGRPAGLGKGYYVTPTVFTDVDPGVKLAREEVFGPVLAVIPYRTEDEAVRITNSTDYGLHGAVWAGTDEHAHAVARRIRSGVIDINGGSFNVLAPFGGMKRSGFGRECGAEGLDAFLEVQSVQEPGASGELTGPQLRDVS